MAQGSRWVPSPGSLARKQNLKPGIKKQACNPSTLEAAAEGQSVRLHMEIRKTEAERDRERELVSGPASSVPDQNLCFQQSPLTVCKFVELQSWFHDYWFANPHLVLRSTSAIWNFSHAETLVFLSGLRLRKLYRWSWIHCSLSGTIKLQSVFDSAELS